MGKSSIVRNVIELTERVDTVSNKVHMAWNSKNYGKPTGENIEKFVVSYIKSLMPGGVNEHIFKGRTIPNISKAKVRNQLSGVVVEWNAPMFFVID